MKKILINLKDLVSEIAKKQINIILDHKKSIILIAMMTLMIWIIISIFVGCLMGVEILLYVLFPLLIFSVQVSLLIYLITVIARCFTKRIRHQNEQFRIELKKEKELLGKIAK